MRLVIFNDRDEEYATLTPNPAMEFRYGREGDYLEQNAWLDDDGDPCTLAEVIYDSGSDLA